MDNFARNFRIDLLESQMEANPWFVDMLRLWEPSGSTRGNAEPAPQHASNTEESEDARTPLRLAIRDGYINFYRAGQSVARVGFTTDRKLQAHVHNKYILGSSGAGNGYVKLKLDEIHLTGGDKRKYRGATDLRDWIANATSHIGEEKRFVDMMVANNADVIDLEMALPAFGPERVAPRMDLVALERAGQRLQIVFWEVKLVRDPRGRRKGEEAQPKVVEQLERYEKWLKHNDHMNLVASEYQKVCNLLIQFHELAKKINPRIGNLGARIIEADASSHAAPLLLDPRPRLLIDNRENNVSFFQNGHLKKLHDKSLFVQVVTDGSQGFSLASTDAPTGDLAVLDHQT